MTLEDRITQLETECKETRQALESILPFVDDAEDVASVFPESAASDQCRAAVQLVRAVLAKYP